MNSYYITYRNFSEFRFSNTAGSTGLTISPRRYLENEKRAGTKATFLLYIEEDVRYKQVYINQVQNKFYTHRYSRAFSSLKTFGFSLTVDPRPISLQQIYSHWKCFQTDIYFATMSRFVQTELQFTGMPRDKNARILIM